MILAFAIVFGLGVIAGQALMIATHKRILGERV